MKGIYRKHNILVNSLREEIKTKDIMSQARRDALNDSTNQISTLEEALKTSEENGEKLAWAGEKLKDKVDEKPTENQIENVEKKD